MSWWSATPAPCSDGEPRDAHPAKPGADAPLWTAPHRELGQCFLVDSNILGVLGHAAELGPADVVLEIGGGLGVLSEYLAARVAHLHVNEIDTRLRAALLDATDPFQNITVHWGDAMSLALAALDPPPDKLIANLPYGIAAGVLLRTIEQCPRIERWVAMVQREVGQRLAASPASPAYGATSAIAQLACQVKVLRPIPRTVFAPMPNVDSVLLEKDPHRAGAADRAAAPGQRRLCPPAQGAGTLAAVCRPPPRYPREPTRAALQELGHPADVRAERLGPADFRALYEHLG